MLAKIKQINAIPDDMQTARNRSVNGTQLKKPTLENENQLRSANTQNLHFADELAIMDNFFENCTVETRQFMHLQLKAAKTKDSRGHRWKSQFLALCLRWYCKSPNTYDDVRSAKFFYMPSPRLLNMYKNTVEQKTGINDSLLLWMWKSAQSLQPPLPLEGRCGDLILDECSIQEYLTVKFRSDGIRVTSFVDLGLESEKLDQLLGTSEKSLATHVLQFVFIGYTGYRWPVCHYPTNQAKAIDLYINVWQIIVKLLKYDFHVEYICMDGAVQNRQLMYMHFSHEEAVTSNYSIPNHIIPTKKLHFTVDYSHVCKRICNNVFSSRKGKEKPRLLTRRGQTITWESWENAYAWDSNTNICR